MELLLVVLVLAAWLIALAVAGRRWFGPAREFRDADRTTKGAVSQAIQGRALPAAGAAAWPSMLALAKRAAQRGRTFYLVTAGFWSTLFLLEVTGDRGWEMYLQLVVAAACAVSAFLMHRQIRSADHLLAGTPV